jgi:hypothetical protein
VFLSDTPGLIKNLTISFWSCNFEAYTRTDIAVTPATLLLLCCLFNAQIPAIVHTVHKTHVGIRLNLELFIRSQHPTLSTNNNQIPIACIADG